MWAVRFNTNDGFCHPVWWGERNGPKLERSQVERLASKYLKEHSDWLTSVDDIYPMTDSTLHTKG